MTVVPIEWIGIFSDGIRKLLLEGLPALFSSRFSYRLEVEAHMRNQLPSRSSGNQKEAVITVVVTIRNKGTKPEFLHQCGIDGRYSGSDSSTIAQWKQLEKLEDRAFRECELRFSNSHEPIIRGVWVENGLKQRWHLPKRQLKSLNSQLRSIVERNERAIAKSTL